MTSDQIKEAQKNSALDYQQLVGGWNGQANNSETRQSRPKQSGGDDHNRVFSPDGFDDVNLSKIVDGQIQETLELSDLISQKSEAGANPDQVCEIIRMTCVSYGFPDCGHLFSNQKKDVQ